MLDPNFFDAQVNLGNALLDAGELDAALPCYRQALALNPRAASAHNNPRQPASRDAPADRGHRRLP